MAGVIANKLGVQMGHAPITSVSYLRIYYALFRNLAKEIGGQFFDFYQQLIKLEELENRLEILLCDVKTTVITPSTLALVLICLHLDFHIKESYTKGSPELKHVFEYILFLQQYMRVRLKQIIILYVYNNNLFFDFTRFPIVFSLVDLALFLAFCHITMDKTNSPISNVWSGNYQVELFAFCDQPIVFHPIYLPLRKGYQMPWMMAVDQGRAQ